MAIYTSAFRIFGTVVSHPKYGDSTVGTCTAVPPNTNLKFDTRLELALKLSEGVELDSNGDGVGDGVWAYPIEQVRWIDSYVRADGLSRSKGDAHSRLVLVVSSASLEDMTEESPWIVALTVGATYDRWNSDGSSTYFHFMLPPGASSNATLFSGPERSSSTFWTAFRKCYEE